MNGQKQSACFAMAALCGRNFLWTQGGGGNVSFFDEDRLWIKRSGVRLRELDDTSDLVPLPLQEVRGLFFSDAPDMDDRLEGLAPEEGGAPSVEAFFHSLLGPWTAHAHLVSATALVSTGTDPGVPTAQLERTLGVFCAWVPYASPGSALAREVHRKLPAEKPASGVLLLRNHGAVVWGPDPVDVMKLFDDVDVACRDLLGLPPGPGALPDRLQAAAFDPEGAELTGELWSGDVDAAALQAPWTPDAALHFGHGLVPVDGAPPALGRLFLRDQRIFYSCAHPDILANAVEIVSAQLTAHLWTDGGLSYLNADQTDALLRWGAGKYGTAAK
ncbi:class II aldolase/adducin family protein [Myxococcota bacterium]|nr:class II aldolase/adducin family protein [Myxococcota bacterium]MBU1411444.1 class II aldolase/adducin family protein [Myxococcota bacterium]MBU1510639.1 class II aldolase/adducin family protein [Myxococcota bacterium]